MLTSCFKHEHECHCGSIIFTGTLLGINIKNGQECEEKKEVVFFFHATLIPLAQRKNARNKAYKEHKSHYQHEIQPLL